MFRDSPTGPPLWGWDDFARFVAALQELTGARRSLTLGELFDPERETTAGQDLALLDLQMKMAQEFARSRAETYLDGRNPTGMYGLLWELAERERWESTGHEHPPPALGAREVGALAAETLGARKRANRVKTFRETAAGIGRVAAALEDRAAGIRGGEIDA